MRVEMFAHGPSNMCVIGYTIAIFTFTFEKRQELHSSQRCSGTNASALFATIIKIKLRVTEHFYLKNRSSKKVNTKQPNEIKIALHNIMNGKRNGNAMSTLNPFESTQKCTAVSRYNYYALHTAKEDRLTDDRGENKTIKKNCNGLHRCSQQKVTIKKGNIFEWVRR